MIIGKQYLCYINRKRTFTNDFSVIEMGQAALFLMTVECTTLKNGLNGTCFAGLDL